MKTRISASGMEVFYLKVLSGMERGHMTMQRDTEPQERALTLKIWADVSEGHYLHVPPRLGAAD